MEMLKPKNKDELLIMLLEFKTRIDPSDLPVEEYESACLQFVGMTIANMANASAHAYGADEGLKAHELLCALQEIVKRLSAKPGELDTKSIVDAARTAVSRIVQTYEFPDGDAPIMIEICSALVFGFLEMGASIEQNLKRIDAVLARVRENIRLNLERLAGEARVAGGGKLS